ncbi:MAG: molybdenum cofactor biosynthesis protein MoaE [Desulfurococcaceae archaeon]|nr:molybdenum cofactor biosynthesis protein MoaE [Sulfolobales archaeon]MDW8170671.1 molybdenum cofactor biosynthesis protein MoaE [Desulfurococcaceae archaeon]
MESRKVIRAEVTLSDVSLNDVVEELISKTAGTGAGALASFIGFVKGLVNGSSVIELEYTAYEPYASRKILEIAEEESLDEDVAGVYVVHRVGRLKPGEPTIYVFVAARSREKAFEKAKRILERVKMEVPIYKLERRSDGEYWVIGDGLRIPRGKLSDLK